jgi:dUTP pyrophosphatase
MDIPEGYEIQVRPRSGLSAKTSLRIANSIGTVDQDYQGDVSVIIWNASDSIAVIKAGDRIAQAVLCPVVLPQVEEVSSFNSLTNRGTNGFGSTGI